MSERIGVSAIGFRLTAKRKNARRTPRRDGAAGRRRRRVRCRQPGCRLTALAANRFDGCEVRPHFIPSRRARAFALEASGEGAGNENHARATFPAAGTLVEFT
jgi:hypothetical protein